VSVSDELLGPSHWLPSASETFMVQPLPPTLPWPLRGAFVVPSAEPLPVPVLVRGTIACISKIVGSLLGPQSIAMAMETEW
jgi:hypothetical protein